MKARTALFLSSAFILLSCVVGNDSEPNKEIKNSVFYHNQLGFSIHLPPNWKHTLDQEVTGIRTEFITMNEPENGFSANVLAIKTKHSGTSDMNVVLANFKQELGQKFPGANFISEAVFERDGVQVAKLIYSGDYFGNILVFKELLFIRKGMDIQVVFTDHSSTFDTRTEFTQIEESLSFK